jgi:DNA helicase HerA-like ATPase
VPHEPSVATHDTGPVDVPANVVRLGVVDSLRAEPILLPLEDIKTHMAFLGSTGSGKTTAALSVVEQLLERDVSIVLVDRKGDLARYVSDTWWNDPAVTPADRERKRALRKRIDIALFTPGNSQGRPLRLPLVPAMADAKPQEREQLARYAADGLGAMMGYSKTAAHKAKASILQCAIMIHGDERDITLDLLRDTIGRPDPELLNAVGALQRHFASLSEDLQTLRIQRGSLLSGDGEPLELATLLPPPGTGRPRLSIINTSALTEVPVLQFWISRLLIELSRLGRKRPSSTLQAAAFFDEADTYVPATSSPPTKDPMFDLLRRSRSTGIGVLLATQNPGDFDYKARDNIHTWLLGKITQDRASEKMRNLIGSYPDVGPRLASQRTGSFFLLTGQTKRELKADRSLMETVQLAEAEVAELARRTRPAGAVRERASV